MHRVLVVPWSNAAAYLATVLSSSLSVLVRSAGRAAACGGLRGGLEQQVRRRRTGVLMAGAALAEVARTALARHHRHGSLHALAGGIGRPLERGGDVVAAVPAQRLERRSERVQHRLVARLGLAALDHALHAGVERL